jgi:hypothetical protein
MDGTEDDAMLNQTQSDLDAILAGGNAMRDALSAAVIAGQLDDAAVQRVYHALTAFLGACTGAVVRANARAAEAEVLAEVLTAQNQELRGSHIHWLQRVCRAPFN